jgi:hypothetical protein
MPRPKKEIFRGNDNLKAENAAEMVSKEEFEFRAKEIVRCRNDITYFANKYFTIVSPGKGKHIIELFPKQNDFLKDMATHDRLVCLSSRQTSKCCSGSTYIVVRNKKTLEVELLTIEEFHKKIQRQSLDV